MVQNRHGAEHVSLSYKLMYWVLAAAAAGIAATSGIRIGHLIGRDRHGIDAADQLGSLRLLIGGEESVLSRLRSLELQALVFSRQSSNLVLGQEVQDCAAVGVGVVDDVPRAVLDGVAGIASLSCHVVPDAVNAPLGIAAALRQLGADGVKARLRLIAQVAHSGIHAMEAVAHGIPDGGLAVLETVQGEALVDVRPGGPALTRGRTQAIAGVTTPAAAIAAPAEHTEDQEQDNPGGPIAAPAAETAVSALIGRSHGHGHHSAVRRKTHCVISFVDLFSKPGRDFDLM
nr:MAG TPA: hypothetical protein [Caudoviricetes sp.]